MRFKVSRCAGWVLGLCLTLACLLPAGSAQTSPIPGQSSGSPADSPSAQGGQTQPTGELHAAGSSTSRLGPLDPAPAPSRVFARPRIGLALGGGAALALSEVGVLQWLEENHIPVDMIAGTSMGCMVSALYATGRTPDELTTVMNDKVFSSVFTFSNAYTSRSFRRRQDARELPNGITVGLRRGVTFRNALLTDQGLNAFVQREFLRYDDRTDFNSLPIPLRCIATDLNTAEPATFARGSLPDAVRASVAIPAVFSPFELNGHEYVDGGILENLPTPAVRAMQPDVVLAVSLPLSPVGKGQLDSILGVVGRTASVAIEASEREQRKLADVVLIPDVSGFSPNDFLQTAGLAKRGYAAAEAHRAELLKYAVPDAEWQAYLAHRASLRRGPPAPVLEVKVNAPDRSASEEMRKLFTPMVNQPVNTARIEALLDEVRADGRYNADYTVGYHDPAARTMGAGILAGPADRAVGTSASGIQTAGAANTNPNTVDAPEAPPNSRTLPATAATLADTPDRPVILVNVTQKSSGPPFVLVGADVQAQTGGITRATVSGILIDQDLGGYGAELRSHVTAGYLTQLDTEYFRPLNFLAAAGRSGDGTFFVAPSAAFHREPFPIFSGLTRVASRTLEYERAGADVGLTNQRTQELRLGLHFLHESWTTEIGSDGQPNLAGNAQRARLLYTLDTQDRAQVPQFGVQLRSELAFLSDARSFASQQSPSQNAPEFTTQFLFAHRFGARKPLSTIDPGRDRGREVLLLHAEGGTYFGRSVAEPFRFTLGGPFRLAASTLDQYRGTDDFLIAPAMLRRIAQLPRVLGQSVYVGGGYELGQMRAPGTANLTRQDAWFGLLAETPLGVITIAPALGTKDEYKLVFTLGRFF